VLFQIHPVGGWKWEKGEALRHSNEADQQHSKTRVGLEVHIAGSSSMMMNMCQLSRGGKLKRNSD
jgi:hypothetical protein